jgi:hypothetical protein
MQTFLTSTQSFTETARSLDNKRLNKQALEAWQIMMVNLRLTPDGNIRQGKAWANHPATLMWTGCEMLLQHYINCMVSEWKRRGYSSTIASNAQRTMNQAEEQGLLNGFQLPQWLADENTYEQIVASHRRALLVKDYERYRHNKWLDDQPSTYEYVWIKSGF